MKNINIFVSLLIAVFFLTVFSHAQNKDKKDCCKDSSSFKNKMSIQSMTYKNSDSAKTDDLVRKGKIDLKSIDQNKDGKVFQDMMDWNVISDKAGKCPLCGMTLKEVSIDEAKVNLIKHNFKTEQN
jgi:hypothetical protein